MVQEKDAGQPEFHQAVKEVMCSLEPTVDKHPEFVKYKIYERIVVPDRAVAFRVPWVDDQGEVQVNRGYGVQFNGAIGPYKGGLREILALAQERSVICLDIIKRSRMSIPAC